MNVNVLRRGMHKKILPLLIAMVLLSCFAGMSINGNWFFTYQFEIFDVPAMIIAGQSDLREIIFWPIVCLAHIGIVVLVFLINSISFRKYLLYLPIIYLGGYLFLRAEFLVLLIPFIICWIIALRIGRKVRTTSINSNAGLS